LPSKQGNLFQPAAGAVAPPNVRLGTRGDTLAIRARPSERPDGARGHAARTERVVTRLPLGRHLFASARGGGPFATLFGLRQLIRHQLAADQANVEKLVIGHRRRGRYVAQIVLPAELPPPGVEGNHPPPSG